MNSIHFVLEKLETKDQNKINKWLDVRNSIPGISIPIRSGGACPESILVIPDESALPFLAQAILAAEGGYFSYRLVFNGDGGEWKRTP